METQEISKINNTHQGVHNVIYTWRLFRTSYVDDLLVHGYYRQNYNKQKDESIMHIIQLFLQCNKTTIYQHTINHIRAAENKEDFFESPIFMNESYPFYLSLYPINDDKEIKIRISLAAFPSGFDDSNDEVQFNFKLHIKEINVTAEKTVTFQNTAEGRHGIFEFQDITLHHIKHLNNLTFYLIDDHNRKCLTQSIQFPTAKYKWHIKKKLNEALDLNDFCLTSFLYGPFEWNLKLFKGDKEKLSLQIGLASLPSHTSEIWLQFRAWIGNCEGQHHFTDCISLNKNKLTHELGTVTISGELIVYVEICIYKAYESDKIMIVKYVEQFANSDPKVVEIDPPYEGHSTWQICSTPLVDDLICFGFVRQRIDKYIAAEIIEKIKWFLQFSGQISLNHIKNANENKRFTSPVFVAEKMKLYLELVPNYNGKFMVEVHSLTSSADINCNFKLCVKELQAECVQDVILKKGYSTQFVFEDIEMNSMKHLQQLTMQLLYHNKSKDSISKSIELPFGEYKWNIVNPTLINAITCAKDNEFITSSQFSYGPCVWHVILYPNTDGKVWLGIHATSIPQLIKSISIKCELFLEETNSIFQSDIFEFNHNKFHNKLSHDIGPKIKDITTVNVLTKIYIYDIEYYDKNSWVRTFHIDDIIEVKEREKWFKCNVVHVKKDEIKIHYQGWSDKYDEYIHICSDRLKLNESYKTKKNKMYNELVSNEQKTTEIFAVNNCQQFEVKNVEKYPSEYTWPISNIKQVINTSNSFGFKSKIFTAYSLKWILIIKGKTEQSKGIVELSLHLLSRPSKDLSIYGVYMIDFIQINYNYTQTFSFSNNKQKLITFPLEEPLLRENILDLELLSIKFRIENINIYRNEDFDVTEYFLNKYNNNQCRNMIDSKKETFEWNISNQLIGNKMKEYSFESGRFEMYKRTWWLSVSPAKNSIVLHFSPKASWGEFDYDHSYTSIFSEKKLKADKIFYVLCILTMVEEEEEKTNYIFNAELCATSSKFEFSCDLMGNYLGNCVIKLEMELIDVYECSQSWLSKNLTENYYKVEKKSECDKRFEKLTESVNKIATNFDRYDERLNKFTDTMNNMMKEMTKAMISMNTCHNEKDDEKEMDELKLWFTNEVKLPQYYSLFIKNGIENLETVKLIGNDELETMKIKLIGHKLKILHHIKILSNTA